MTDVERILNSRPLTHISNNIEDLNALTPNHILFGKHKLWEYLDCDIDERDISSRKHYRQVQALTAVFWQRWRREYLPDLTKRSKWQAKIRNIEVGELVLLNDDDDNRRKKWPLARVTKVVPGRYGVVRVVEIKTKDGSYVRPVTKLHRLEDNDN